MIDFSNPQNVALAAALFGGRMMQGSLQPGGTIGSGLANAITSAPQDLMQYHQAAQMSKMRELQIAQAQQEMAQQQEQNRARQQLAMDVQTQAAQDQTPQLGAMRGLPGMGSQNVPYQYRPVPQINQNMATLLGAGDMEGAKFLQQQDELRMAHQAAAQKAVREQQANEYSMQQDLIKNKMEQERIAIQQGNLRVNQQTAQRGRYGQPVASIDPQTGQEIYARYNEAKGTMEPIQGASPRPKVGVFGEGGMTVSKDGTITFGGGKNLPSSTESSTANNLIDQVNRAKEYGQIITQTKPEYFELATKGKDFLHELKSSLGDHQFDKMLADRDDWMQKATSQSVQLRNSLLGSALTPTEVKASEAMLPDAKKDGFQKFISKAVSLEYTARRYAERYQDYLNSGMSKDEFAKQNPLSNYETAQSRGDELYKRYMLQGNSPQEAKRLAIEELRGESTRLNPVSSYYNGMR